MKVRISSNINDYEAIFGEAFTNLLADLLDEGTVFIIDKNVYDIYIDEFREIFKGEDIAARCYFVDAIESNKTMSKAQ